MWSAEALQRELQREVGAVEAAKILRTLARARAAPVVHLTHVLTATGIEMQEACTQHAQAVAEMRTAAVARARRLQHREVRTMSARQHDGGLDGVPPPPSLQERIKQFRRQAHETAEHQQARLRASMLSRIPPPPDDGGRSRAAAERPPDWCGVTPPSVTAAIRRARGLTAAELSDVELREVLDAALRAVEPGFIAIEAVLPESLTVVYLVAPDPQTPSVVQRSYNIDGIDTVTLLDDRQNVRPVQRYAPVDYSALAAPRASATTAAHDAPPPPPSLSDKLRELRGKR